MYFNPFIKLFQHSTDIYGDSKHVGHELDNPGHAQNKYDFIHHIHSPAEKSYEKEIQTTYFLFGFLLSVFLDIWIAS